MYIDARGHSITTESSVAAKAFTKTIEAYAGRQASSSVFMQEALDADPKCVMLNAVKGLMLQGARTIAFKEQAIELLSVAKENVANVSAREQHYVKALELSLAGQLENSVRSFEAVLDEYPTDLLALLFLQSELFWLGEMVWSERVSAKLVQHWNESTPGYPAFLAIRAFDLEENNALEEAEKITDLALSINPGEVWGAHTLAHVMLMQNRIDEGIAWMGERETLWDDANQMQYHLAWHHCLFLGERGKHDEMLHIYDNRIRNREHHLCEAMPDLYIDVQNASSLLWRLENAGVNVGHRWQELADVCTPRIGDMSNPFTSAHFAFVLAANEQFDDCEQLVQSMEAFAENTSTSASHDLSKRYQAAALPAAKAAIAHKKGDHETVISCLQPARNSLWQMGGSHAQQDVYFQVLANSMAKLGNKSAHDTLLNDIEKIGFVEPSRRVAYSFN